MDSEELKIEQPNHQSTSSPSLDQQTNQTYSVDEVSTELFSSTRFCIGGRINEPVIMEFCGKFGRLEYSDRIKTWTLPLSEYHEFIHCLKSKNIEVQELPPSSIKIARDLEAQNKIDPQITTNIYKEKVPPDLRNTLMPFQEEGVKFGIQQEGRVFIADEMGLGKTLQAVALSHVYRNEWPVLVVCPSPLLLQWEGQFIEWLPDIDKKDIAVIRNSKDTIGKGEKICIISYDMATRLFPVLQQQCFQVVIADECHYLKNICAKRTRCVLPLLQNAKRAILLSGTPALSCPQELFPQIQAIHKNLFQNLHVYSKRYCNATQTKFGWDYRGSSNLREFRVILSSFMIRRVKSEVLQQLPPKQRFCVYIATPENQVEALQKTTSQDKTKEDFDFRLASNLITLFQATGSAKIPAVCEWIAEKLGICMKDSKEENDMGVGNDETTNDNQAFIIFAHHQEVLSAVCHLLQTHKQDYIRIDGQTQHLHRQELVHYFQTTPTCRVAVLSLTTAGLGISLTKATSIIFTELHWNPGCLLQAEDCGHRIGQKFSINVYYLVARNSFDEQLWEKLQLKLEEVSGLGEEENQDSFLPEITNQIERLSLAENSQTNFK